MDVTTTDNDLALLAAKGDGDAFRALLERHYDRVFRIALRFSGGREDAEDVAQDVCMSLPAKLKSFRGDAAFTTWLYRVVVNRVRDVQRKQVTSERIHNDYGEVEDLRRGEEAETAKEMAWLNEAMNHLSDDLRETAVLVVGEGLNHAEAAQIIGIKESTVSWRMHELKKQLKAIAKEEA